MLTSSFVIPFSLRSFRNSDVEVVGIRPVTTVWPLRSCTSLKGTPGDVTIHTAAPFTTLEMTPTGAPLEAATAVHSGPWMENCALFEITADSATLAAPAVSLVTSSPALANSPSSSAT